MKSPTESALVKQCLQWLAYRHPRALVWRQNNTGVYDPTAKRFRSFGGMKGCSDIIGVLPGGRFLAVEVKMPNGKVSKDQKEFIAAIARNGGVSGVVRSIEDLELLFATIGDKDAKIELEALMAGA